MQLISIKAFEGSQNSIDFTSLCNSVYLLFLHGVTDSAVPQGVHISEVIGGHNTAGRPLCHHSLADLRSAVCKASPGTSSLFFPPTGVHIRFLFRHSHRLSTLPSPPHTSAHWGISTLCSSCPILTDLSHVIKAKSPKLDIFKCPWTVKTQRLFFILCLL